MTVVSFYYYLRVVVVMLTPPEGELPEREPVGVSMSTVLAISAAATVILGLFPGVIFDWASTAAGVHL
jgi:NADH-quinone oxidoreductase subunit N